MSERTNRFRFPITTLTVLGLGALVALAVGVSLYLGLSSAMENTRRLMAQRSETLVNDLDRRITSQLQPVVQQAQWTVEQFESGKVRLEDTRALNTFILGALGAMPQVEGIAITNPHALSRRWRKSSPQPLVEDWSDRPGVVAWLEAGASRTVSKWQAPFWTSTLGTTILLLDTPIRIDGKFAGLFSQAVTISDLSRHIASVGTETGVIPFVLYDHDHVLAHPLLISWTPSVSDRDQPLVALDTLGDAVLERIWTPDHPELYLLGGMTEASSSGVTVGDDYYVFLYRVVDRYGPEPWTIGAYVKTGTSEVGEWLAGIVRSAMSGSFENTGTIDGNEFERVVATVFVGLVVLLLSVALAAWLGARASRPLRALAAAARSIEAQRLDRIRTLPPTPCGRRSRCSPRCNAASSPDSGSATASGQHRPARGGRGRREGQVELHRARRRGQSRGPARSAQQGVRDANPGLRSNYDTGGRLRPRADGRGRRPRSDRERRGLCARRRDAVDHQAQAVKSTA